MRRILLAAFLIISAILLADQPRVVRILPNFALDDHLNDGRRWTR
jgi:hypothetical protein